MGIRQVERRKTKERKWGVMRKRKDIKHIYAEHLSSIEKQMQLLLTYKAQRKDGSKRG